MTKHKGIVLAGGASSRLWPTTLGMSKHLLPIYDKPLIYYPLSVLMLAEIRDILIITTPSDQELFKRILGDGSRFGINLTYISQEQPRGIADALVISEGFVNNSPFALILGDNLFHGQAFTPILKDALNSDRGATVFAYPVKDPERFGVVELDRNGSPISLEEKPSSPRSNLAVTGLYIFDNQATNVAKQIRPSGRGEIEITDVNKFYLEKGALTVKVLGRGFAWLDTGTPQAMLEATHFVQTIQSMHGYYIACLEEIGWNSGWLTRKKLLENESLYAKSDYGRYVLGFVKGHRN
jgi:glucose-1-phosphate thymidylyltransferase